MERAKHIISVVRYGLVCLLLLCITANGVIKVPALLSQTAFAFSVTKKTKTTSDTDQGLPVDENENLSENFPGKTGHLGVLLHSLRETWLMSGFVEVLFYKSHPNLSYGHSSGIPLYLVKRVLLI